MGKDYIPLLYGDIWSWEEINSNYIFYTYTYIRDVQNIKLIPHHIHLEVRFLKKNFMHIYICVCVCISIATKRLCPGEMCVGLGICIIIFWSSSSSWSQYQYDDGNLVVSPSHQRPHVYVDPMMRYIWETHLSDTLLLLSRRPGFIYL